MKRDMRLIKSLLEHAEEHGNGEEIPLPTLTSWDTKAIEYHWELCQEAGFINGSHLTWEGHERLAVLRKHPLFPPR